MTTDLIRPAIFSVHEVVFAAFTTRHFAPPDRISAQSAAAALVKREGFSGLALTEQVHDNKVAVVREPGTVPGHDGLVTDQPGLALGTVAADCALIMIVDPIAGVVGNCHAGWRGAAAEIVTGTVERMVGLGARPSDMLAFIGPCISTEAFEVGEEVAAQFDPAHIIRRSDWPKPHVDLRAVVRKQLLDSGVRKRNIETSGHCTMEDEGFYSYRGQNGTPGRMLALIGMRHE